MSRGALVTRVLEGEGEASREARRAAFDNKSDIALVDKVAKTAWKITDDDVAAAKATLSEDAVFELVVCAAIGQATRQLDAALAALDTVEE
jgi:hypothetical protein